MVDALASDRSDQSFGEAVLPRRAWRDGFVTDAHGSQSAPDGSAVDLIPITDQVARGLIPRECLRDLARNPFRGRMRCDVDPDEVSAGQSHDDEDIEQIEANGRGNEQVHGGDVRCVVTQEGAPSLGGRSRSLDHVLRDAGLSDLEAELQQLAMDTRRAPQRILSAHPPDQRAQVRIDFGRPPRERDFHRQYRRKPARCQRMRVSGRTIVMALRTEWKPSIQHDQEQAIPVRELDATAYPPLQHNQLMSERRVLCRKSVLRLERRDEQGQEEPEQRDHRC